MDSTGQSTSAGGGTGLTTAQARQSSSYTGWDFSTGWYQAGDMRPILRSEAAVPVNNVATITNMHQLALINTNLSGSYVLGTDIDASATAGTNASGIWGAGGFVPIGNSNTSFAGAFDGQGHVITGLYINRPSIRDVGLFGYTDSFATIRNIGLAGGSVRGDSIVGGLVGNNYGAVSNVYATGAVSGGSDVGGLVGGNFGALSNVYASGAVSGNLFVGGLVGTNYGAVSNVYASGAVSGNVAVGGLVGNNYGALSNSYASGAVSGNHQVGGLVGSNYGGTVANSYASGAVSSRYDVSGLIGVSDGLVTDSFWNVDSTGQSTSSGGGTGLTTAQMNNPFTFIDAGWDFVSVWGTPKAGGAPVLRDLASDPVYTYYVRLSGNTTTTYGDTIETAGITLDGIGANRVSVGWGSAISATTNAGTYGYADANVVALNYGLGAEGDYFVDHGTGSLTIDRRTLTVTADAQSKTYGDVNPTLTYSTSGLVNGDTVTGSLGTSAGQYSGVGNYAITGSFTASSNYVLTYTGADLTVTPRSITVTADAQSKTYGDVNPVLTYTAAGLVNGDTLGGSLATFAGQYSNTGDYGIVLGTLMNSNYAISYTGANLTVGTRAVAVTADALSKSYGDVNPTMTYTATGLVNGDTLSGSLTTSAGRYSDVGVYAIGQGTLANGNYAINYTSANLTIGQRALSVMADAVSKTYGDMNPTLTYTATGLVNNDMLSGGLTTSTGQYSDVGTYGVTVGTLAASSNYALSYTGSTLTVTPKTISVVAGALFKTYGDVNPALTYTVSGLVNNDILSGSLTTSAGRYSDVGAYAIERGTLAASSNYVIDYAGANLTIGARSITVVADATSRLYGDVNPVFTYVATGLVNGDNLSGVLATAADAHSSAGSYAINQGTLANANYAISYTESNLTIGQRAITVTANNLKRYYGTANPPLTWTVGGLGLVNGDTLSGGLTTTATRTSSLGQYTIMQGTLMASANYAMTFNPATLTVAALLAMPSGASASSLGDSGKAFDMGRFAALPPVTGNGKQGADGSTILISDPRFAQTIVCVDDDVCAVAPRPTLH
ncbi:UNVERIFIED_ORG: hypothetical protein J2W19_001098 [Shinella zoogloeoides]|nr:hypothetical protein [Shinella zoogloeoides]